MVLLCEKCGAETLANTVCSECGYMNEPVKKGAWRVWRKAPPVKRKVQ